MSVSLTKGGNVSLSKEAPGLSKIVVGLGWDARSTDGADFDLDASAIVLGEDGKVLNEGSFVFYGNLASSDGTVTHLGDNLTGAGDGDDEQIKVDLAGLPAEAAKVIFPVTVYEADSRGQNFGMVANAFIRVVNDDGSNTEIARFDLSEDGAVETCMLFAEVYRHGGDWKLKAMQMGYATGLKGLATDYGVAVA